MEKVHTVAVIGAGISGVCATAHLLKHGLSPTLFERSSVAGGVWHFDKHAAHEPPYPNEVASQGDYKRVLFDEHGYSTPPRTPERKSSADRLLEDDSKAEADAIAHAPPGPCYAGLMNNVSLPAMQTSLAAWPEGLEDFVSQKYLEQYIQYIASLHGVNEVTQYRTRVEDVAKFGAKWRVLTTTLDQSTGKRRLIRRTNFFDAVVVASGHYHMPRVPNIPGLVKLKEAFPDRVQHSKGYRDASGFKDSNVLLIGAGVSSWDITKEIHTVGGRSYQSSRGGSFDLPASSLPPSSTRVAGVEAFEFQETRTTVLEKHLPVTIKLSDGTALTDIDHVILATGYITSYPFLPNLHSDSKTVQEADDFVLVTEEGNMCHNLYKDIFYIEDPTLSFIGVPYHISTFSLFDIQAEAVARQLAGQAKLPSKAIMREEYVKRVKEKGLGREFHSLRATGAEIGYALDLVRWVNSALPLDTTPMIGHTQTFYAAHRLQREKLAERFGGKLEDWVGLIPGPGDVELQQSGV